MFSVAGLWNSDCVALKHHTSTRNTAPRSLPHQLRSRSSSGPCARYAAELRSRTDWRASLVEQLRQLRAQCGQGLDEGIREGLDLATLQDLEGEVQPEPQNREGVPP